MKLSKSYYLFIFQRTAIVTDLKKKKQLKQESDLIENILIQQLRKRFV